MHAEWLLNIPFDILDAAVLECLPGYAPRGWVEFERKVLTHSSVQYKMFLKEWGDLGDLGSITIRKVDPDKSILYVQNPIRPRPRQPTQEEWQAQSFAQYPRDIRLSKKLEFFRVFRDEADDQYQRRNDHQKMIIQAMFSRLSDDTATESYLAQQNEIAITESEPADPVEEFRVKLRDFKGFVERQAYGDIFVNGLPQENIARSLLQAFLESRSYREVPVKGGRSDILVHVDQGRLLFETKIWRGPNYYRKGLDEIEEYILGENDNNRLISAFYLVFDPTRTHRAVKKLGMPQFPERVQDFNVEVFIIDLAPPTPSSR